MATLTFEPMPVPLREDAHGAIRVGDTRVLLDLVIQEFRNGATPEGIVESYDALTLAEVYAVISYYLRHSDEIDTYLDRREQEARAVRERIEALQPPRPNLRAALMARAKAREKAGAQTD
ncbi:MAG TPA: DUF433 domain-containing protein [Isosphaeraceae bacterium]|nr:DUF433 domain-containing protein [Isosphaeraceae bacterium]